MTSDKIKVRTESGQTLDAEITSLKTDAIWIVLGEGQNSIKCKLVPTRNGLAYAGSVMGREIVYERSVKQVREDIAGSEQNADRFKWRK